MKNSTPKFLSIRFYLTVLSILAIVVFSGLYFFQVSAKTKVTDTTNRSLTLGKIAYTKAAFTFGGPRTGIEVADADGSNPTTVAANFLQISPTWSPDRVTIAYVSGGSILGKSSSSGTSQGSITSGQSLRSPSWSITNKVVYERNSQIWTVNPDGSSNAQFTAITQPSPQNPDWSPNGSKIAFVSNGEIWIINADGTGEQRVTNNSSADTDPAWSPDGTKIVFTKGGSGIAVINIDGTGEMNLTTASIDRSPDWSPDGSTIAFRRGLDYTADAESGIYLMPASGGSSPVRIIADVPGSTGNSNGEPSWQPNAVAVSRPAQFDFDGDFKSDISVFRPADGTWYLQRSTAGLAALQWGISTDVLAPADYDGDQKTDVAVWRPADGNYYILNSLNNTVRVEAFGQAGDVPTGGDWDGDGKADLAVYRDGSQSTFYYRASAGNPQGYVSFVPWGTSGDKPVTGDYDGDGKTDAAVYRNGTWYIRRSSDAQLSAFAFGAATDKVVPADYDGDGRTDAAVFRDGIWYMLRSTQGTLAFQFGQANDIPAPADYDGDGKADAAIYRGGVWWMLRSQTGSAQAVPFGTNTDKPLPAAFVR